jgi:hypothetical protein
VDLAGPCDSGRTDTDRPSPSPFEVVRSVAATSPHVQQEEPRWRDSLSVDACHFRQANHLGAVLLAGANAQQERWTRICIYTLTACK